VRVSGPGTPSPTARWSIDTTGWISASVPHRNTVGDVELGAVDLAAFDHHAQVLPGEFGHCVQRDPLQHAARARRRDQRAVADHHHA
jgi:hypothetical protein